MVFTYTTYSFDKQTGTMTIGFEGYDPLNYNAPRANGVYLTGGVLESYIQNLHPTIIESLNYDQPIIKGTYLTGEDLYAFMTKHPNYIRDNEIIASQIFTDDPSTISGGEDIQAKYQAYIDSVV